MHHPPQRTFEVGSGEFLLQLKVQAIMTPAVQSADWGCD